MTLSFGEPQVAVGLAFAGIAVALALTFALIARSSLREVPLEDVRRSAYRLRRFWLAFLIVLLGGAVGGSLFLLPYSAGDEARATVKVSGGQFYWSLSPTTVAAGSDVTFDVSSVDVNHGFGVYDPDGQLLGSVQAMPGYHNRLELELKKPGTYLLSCLEFCGVKHHEMTREFEVSGAAQ
jgi:cytochrome c oxidase subunit 2